MAQQKNNKFLEKLSAIEKRYEELETLLLTPEVIKEGGFYQKYAKERSAISGVVANYRKFKNAQEECRKLKDLIAKGDEDKELKDLANEELKSFSLELESLKQELEDYLIEEDPNINKNVIIEIRAGTGGEEAGLFVADLYKMYVKFAAEVGFKTEVMSSNATELGGFKEIIFSITGVGAYRLFKFESGVHRVQRVPATEASGRIHTSAVSVAVLPEAEEIDLEIQPNDLKIDVYRSGGCGGQSVNTTDSAVRITHLPTGMVVTCQDERSQLKNKHRAMKILRSRLFDKYQQDQQTKIENTRRMQIGTGDRSEKIRTYNFPEKRVTDHRINLTLYKLDSILIGNLKELVTALQQAERQLKLNSAHNDN